MDAGINFFVFIWFVKTNMNLVLYCPKNTKKKQFYKFCQVHKQPGNIWGTTYNDNSRIPEQNIKTNFEARKHLYPQN